jgi:lipooligosaccharide transport system permease protein
VIMRLGIVPLFLFSGTLFPVSQLPGWMQPLCWFSPLWHGVQLCRGATTGAIDGPEAVANVLVLCAVALAGAVWGVRSFTRKLAI